MALDPVSVFVVTLGLFCFGVICGQWVERGQSRGSRE